MTAHLIGSIQQVLDLGRDICSNPDCGISLEGFPSNDTVNHRYLKINSQKAPVCTNCFSGSFGEGLDEYPNECAKLLE